MARQRKNRNEPVAAPAQPRGFRKVNPSAAGIDCGSDAHYVAVPEDRDPQPVRRFGAFTADLVALGARATSRITPMEEVPLGIPTLVLTAAGTHAIRHGRPCGLSEVAKPLPPLPSGRCRLKGPEGGLIGIGEVQLQAPSEARPVIRPQIVFTG